MEKFSFLIALNIGIYFFPEKYAKGRFMMIIRALFIGIIVLELFGCSSTNLGEDLVSEQCYESEYMSQNDNCLDSEIYKLEEDLNDRERTIYEMAKRKISDKYHQLYFLRLSPVERRDYLAYLYDGEPPVYMRRNSIF